MPTFRFCAPFAMASQVAQVVNASKENHKFDSSIPYVHFTFFCFTKPEPQRSKASRARLELLEAQRQLANSAAAKESFGQVFFRRCGPQMDPKKEASDRLYIKLFFRVSFIFSIQLGWFHFLYMMN